MEQQQLRPFVPGFEKVAVLKAYKCSFCNRIYSAQVHADQIGGRIPLLMPCSHTVCEECIIYMAKSHDICCKVCHYEMRLESLEVLSNIFPVDRFMFGSLMNLNSKVFSRTSSAMDKNDCPFSPAGALLKRGNKEFKRPLPVNGGNSSEKEKDRCSQSGCSKRAEIRCISCNELYCNRCDRRVHESIRILRNHTRYPIGIADLADFNVSCVVHSTSSGEYSCISCGNMLCSKCVIKDHTGHEVIAIEDKNAQELESFKEILQKAKHILRCMEFTQKKVKSEITATRQTQPRDLKPNHLTYDIVKHFATLHSRLQLMEQSILEQLNKAQDAKVDSLHRLSTELAANIDIMYSLVATGNMIAEGGKQHLDKLLLSELEKSIEENLILPCHLVDEVNMKDDNIQFIIDQSFMDALQNHCKIQFEEGQSFKLSPMTDFTEKKYDFPSDDGSASSDCESIRSRNESEASSTTSQISYVKPGCKTRLSLVGNIPTMVTYGNARKTEKPRHTNAPIVFNKDTVETVTVTHLTNPSLFYVQLVRKKKLIDELAQKYEIYADHAATPTEPEIGNTYIVQFTSEKLKKWYRAILNDIHTTGVTTLYEVFYIDYGNSAMVSLSKIRVMKPIFMQDRPFAYKCRLNGIISQRNDWTDDVLSYMVQFITAIRHPPLDPVELDSFLIHSNYSCKMHVIRNEKGTLDVDLYSHNESLSAALIFVGYAQPLTHLLDMSKKRKIVDSESETKIATAYDNYRKDQIYPIHVSHVINPHCIYVQLLANMKIIKNLETAMTRFYNKKDSRKMIFTPEKGMVCVAKLPSSGDNWWRVEIVNLPGRATVEVYAVDYGFTERIPWNQLCKIRDIHKQTDSQAIKVSLSDIAPPKEAEDVWSEETNLFLREYLTDKNLSMLVNAPSKEKLMVTIYEHTDEADICVDALLVRKELAESTSASSLLVEFHKILPGDSEQTSKRNIGQLIDVEKHEKSEDQSKSMMCGKNFIVEVKMVKLLSPGHFYVDIPKWYDEKSKMFKLMTQFYSEQISPAKKWDLNSKCVVRSSKDDKYYRAIVTKIVEDDTYEVFLKDIVRTEEVPTRNIFELDITFATHDYSLLCCLGGVKPAGGTEKWSGKSTEIFQDFVENYNRLFITKYGPIVDNVLSVQLLTSWEETAGPLVPIKTKTLILNEILIQNGLAFKVKVDSDEPVIKDGDTPPLFPKTEKTLAVPGFPFESELLKQSGLSPITKLLEGESALTTENIPTSLAKPIFWLPPTKFPRSRFKAYATNVDMDGSIYIQTAQSKRLLKNVSRILENHFKDSNPDPPHLWEIGQMCTLLYHHDKTYCRGTIFDIIGEKMLVQLIDFGNQEEATHGELRSEVLATDIPALAVKCRLSNVVLKTKDGSWPIPLLDKLHYTLVEHECEVIIDERETDPEDDMPHLLVYFKDECINNLCNTAEWSKQDVKYTQNPRKETIPVVSDDDKSVVVEDDIVDDIEVDVVDVDVDIEDTSVKDIAQTHEKLFNSDLRYNYVQLPNDKTSFKAIVINIIDYRSIVVEPEFIAGLMKETSDQFSIMSDEINKSGPELPEISSPIVGMPCVALFGDDKMWYRAEILDIMDIHATEIKVLFIDYGNVEIVPREDVRSIRQEWVDFPVSMMNFKIWGIQKVPDYDTMDVNAAMKDAVVDKNVICQIQQYTPDIEVKLIDVESYDLVYKQLLDNKIIENVD